MTLNVTDRTKILNIRSCINDEIKFYISYWDGVVPTFNHSIMFLIKNFELDYIRFKIFENKNAIFHLPKNNFSCNIGLQCHCNTMWFSYWTPVPLVPDSNSPEIRSWGHLPDMSEDLLSSILYSYWNLIDIKSWFWYWNILEVNKKFSPRFSTKQLGRRNCLYCYFETVQTFFDFFFDFSCFFLNVSNSKSGL